MANPIILEKRENLGVIWMDAPGEEWNKITPDTEQYFNEAMEIIEKDEEIRAAVLISRKKGFMAGADIERFLQMKPGEAAQTALAGHEMLNRIEDSKKPYVAAIHGACMGGGLEISLACAGRVVSNHSSTVLALPEVKLGLLPGLGGTRRLTRAIGIQKGLDAILTGRNIYGSRAFKIGLADAIVHETKLLEAAKRLALSLSNGEFKRKDKRSFVEKLIEGNPITRNVIFSKAKKIAMAKSYGNYPAVPLIVDTIKYGVEHNRQKSAEFETTQFDKLLSTPESFQLINIFFGMNALKKNPGKDQSKAIDKIGIVGAGLMGEGIGEVSLNGGMKITLGDISDETLVKAKRSIWKSLSKKVKQRSLLKSQAEKLVNDISTTTSLEYFDSADMVIEAVFEDINLKHNVLKEVEQKSNAIFASNTSSLPISKIAEASKHPERVIGMHYFSPVPKMPLLEIITTPKTESWVTATALEVGVRQGKVCIVVNDGPGFYTTRILAPYMNEALLFLEEGGDILFIDRAMKKFGFPVGPFTLMDEVGIDVGAHINKGALGEMFKDRGGEASQLMENLTEAGFKGRKNKKGFLKYDEKGNKIKNKINPEVDQFLKSVNKNLTIEEVQERLSLMMINEAAHCLQENIVSSPRDADIGAVFGLGFPPFRGGPFRMLDAEGIGKMVDNMKRLSDSGAGRFEPAKILTEYVAHNKTFYN